MSRVRRSLLLINREEFRKRRMRVEAKELLRRFRDEKRALRRGGGKTETLVVRSQDQMDGRSEGE